MANRIKSIRQKIGSEQFDNPVPLGADSQYIDMVNELNLEQELYIGCPHKIIISDYTDSQNDATILGTEIRQWYFKKNTIIPELTNFSTVLPPTSGCTYFKITRIPDNGQNSFSIISSIYKDSNPIITTVLFNGQDISEIQGGY